jgi:hypothetical protein
MIRNDFGDFDLGVCGLFCNLLTPITTNKDSRFPIWSPDGNSVVFALREGNGEWLHLLDIDGSARPIGRERPLNPAAEVIPMTFAGSRLLLSREGEKRNTFEIWSMAWDKPHDLKREYGQGRTEYGARATLDGMIAWVSVEKGANRIAAARFPIVTVPHLIGPGAGVVWSAKGDELFFQRGDQIWSQRFVNGAPVGGSAPTAVRGTRTGLTPGPGVPSYDVLPDGRFVIILSSTEAGGPQVPVVVRNWASSFDKRK